MVNPTYVRDRASDHERLSRGMRLTGVSLPSRTQTDILAVSCSSRSSDKEARDPYAEDRKVFEFDVSADIPFGSYEPSLTARRVQVLYIIACPNSCALGPTSWKRY